MSMQDVTSSATAFLQFSIVTLVVVAVAGAIGSTSYFSGSFAFSQAESALMMMDYVALFVTTGFFIVSVGLAALSRNNRVFLPISVIALVINVFLAAVFSDTYVALVESSSFLGGAAESLTILNLLAGNMPLVFGVMGLSVIIALYTSLGGGSRAPR